MCIRDRCHTPPLCFYTFVIHIHMRDFCALWVHLHSETLQTELLSVQYPYFSSLSLSPHSLSPLYLSISPPPSMNKHKKHTESIYACIFTSVCVCLPKQSNNALCIHRRHVFITNVGLPRYPSSLCTLKTTLLKQTP